MTDRETDIQNDGQGERETDRMKDIQNVGQRESRHTEIDRQTET